MSAVKHFRRVLAALILGTAVGVATAGGLCSNCSIKTIGVGPYYDGICASGSCVFVMMDGNVATRPACSTETWNFVLDTATADGRKAYAFLLAAYTAGKPVNVSGSGSCTLYSASENLLYAMFAY